MGTIQAPPTKANCRRYSTVYFNEWGSVERIRRPIGRDDSRGLTLCTFRPMDVPYLPPHLYCLSNYNDEDGMCDAVKTRYQRGSCVQEGNLSII